LGNIEEANIRWWYRQDSESGQQMLRKITAFTISCTLVAWLMCVPSATGRQTETNSFELRGVVLNAATGEPVSGALVQMQAPSGKTQFAGTNGTFVFKNLPQGRYFLMASKPGFFSEQQLGHGNAWMSSMREIPSNEEVALKLTPEGIICGEVRNENGEPIEAVTVRAQRWQMEDGRRRLQNTRDTITDDEGNFRIAELPPGTYNLSFVPTNRGGWITYDKLSRKKQTDEGYGAQFYPGVADAESARPMEVRAGTQVHITQAMKRQKLFEIAGVVRGANPDSGFNLTLMNTTGDIVQQAVRIDRKRGEFQILGVPAGTYMLSAMAQEASESVVEDNRPPRSAMQMIHLNSDLTGVVLPLGRGNSLEVQVRDEVPPDGTNNVHQVMVRLISMEFQQYSPAIMAPATEGQRVKTARFEDIPPGTYTVEATPNFPGYIAALRCGNTDLLRDDLTVTPGVALPPTEATLRNDGARLGVTLAGIGQTAAASVVIYSDEYPKRSVLMQANSTGMFSLERLPPGHYRVIAVKDAQDLEFRNPIAMERYLAHASSVILQPGDETTLRVEMQELQEQQQ
jgi:uncharacterized protein (DUF2141 family)